MKDSNTVFVSETGKKIIRLKRWVAVLAVYSVIATAAFLALVAVNHRTPVAEATPVPSVDAGTGKIVLPATPAPLMPGPEVVNLEPGLYVAGTDFPAGVYSVNVGEGASSSTVYLYRSRSDYEQNFLFTFYIVRPSQRIAREELPAGYVIRVSDPTRLEPYAPGEE